MLTSTSGTMSRQNITMQPTGQGTIQPKDMTAMVMTGPWSVDDTKPNVPEVFRNKIPERFKTNGIFEITAGEEGLLVDVKGEWGRALFFRSQTQIPGKSIKFQSWYSN